MNTDALSTEIFNSNLSRCKVSNQSLLPEIYTKEEFNELIKYINQSSHNHHKKIMLIPGITYITANAHTIFYYYYYGTLVAAMNQGEKLQVLN